jgi:hypothetical protein
MTFNLNSSKCPYIGWNINIIPIPIIRRSRLEATGEVRELHDENFITAFFV